MITTLEKRYITSAISDALIEMDCFENYETAHGIIARCANFISSKCQNNSLNIMVAKLRLNNNEMKKACSKIMNSIK